MTRHTLGTENTAESSSARRTTARSARAHSSHSHRRPPALNAHTATGLKAKIRGRMNSVVIGGAPTPAQVSGPSFPSKGARVAALTAALGISAWSSIPIIYLGGQLLIVVYRHCR